MCLGNDIMEYPYQFNLRSLVGIERGLQAIRHQGLQTAELAPVLKLGGVPKNVQEKGFVIAFEEYRLALATSLNEKIERAAGVWSAVDVVAEVDFNWALNRAVRQVNVN